ncbi:sulfonate ABC transporter substrate-binding protein [Pandoraea apista]|uniref:Putative aliphatic sulfonates-binding protein n=1 Tax=Pandoraea apista TaxID=93218 RepID=A0A0G4JJB7_9BURK|nr:sulfonate ABC transporter substrate-binding protein [Pandoraea apista]ALS63796.1 sulfonate ABC transporter substrate-binding protein [Pandoraea apista]AVF40327.1 sulfonate ABC transporter substrate-binding protein [Pandoraea apista]OXS89802.1 sulfonate ABC transporter substrate-binding protein [Pandoraea apista]RRW98515.1 sulfonate ABC transporter substrate-binding protein [Pandoraea apista]RRX05142.1 sulfonate ABC transporter substrate-binding protein [Pandoraea apista]
MSAQFSAPRRRLLTTGAAALACALAAPAVLAQSGATSATSAAGGGRVLRIGHQKGLLTLLKGRGTLERRLAALGVHVTWTEFPSGPPQLEALNVGSIDFGDVGEAPPVFALAAGAPFVYYGQSVQRPRSEGLLVPKGSAIASFAQLRGKRVAFTKGSNTHYLYVRLLQQAGLKPQDITPVFLQPADARAAFERGSVDAWLVWDPFLAVAQKSLDARLVTDGTGLVGNRLYFFTSRTYVQHNEDVLRAVIEELNTVDKWVEANRADAASEYAQLWGVPRDAVELVLSRQRFGIERITRATLAEQQQIADAFLELNLLPRRIDVVQAAPPSLG